MPEDDPRELFDLYDGEGRPLGRSKPRGRVHKEGDWHRSAHLWVVLSSGEVLLQRRGLQKDTHPGKVDVSVAGHLAAGEADAAASVAREAEEEIGLVVTAVELTHLFVRRHEDVREGHVDRELQDVFVTKTPTRLDDLRPAHDELLGVLAVAFRDARALVDGTATEVGARERRVGGGVARLILRREELVAHDDGYFSRALSAIAGRT